MPDEDEWVVAMESGEKVDFGSGPMVLTPAALRKIAARRNWRIQTIEGSSHIRALVRKKSSWFPEGK